MNPHLAWYAARAGGIVAWALLGAAVIWGLLLSTRLLHGRPTPRWLLDLHRFLGGLAVTFTAVHIGGLVGDNYLHVGAADLLVPFASSWRPGAVALGVVGLWLLIAIEVTSLLMRRLPRRLWHAVHMSSYVLFWTATLHGLLAGTDTHNVAYVVATSSAVTLVLFLTLVRALATPRRARTGGTRRTPVTSRDAATVATGRSSVVPHTSHRSERASPTPPGRTGGGAAADRWPARQPSAGVQTPTRSSSAPAFGDDASAGVGRSKISS